MSNDLKPLVNATVILDLFLISESLTKIPGPILPNFTLNNQTDENGIVTLGEVTFDSGISSLYYVKPLLIYSYYDDLYALGLSSSLQSVVNMIYIPSLRSRLDIDSYNSFTDGLLSLQQLLLIDYLFSDALSFQLVSNIGILKMLNKTQTPSLRYQFGVYYFYQIQVISTKNKAIVNSTVSIDYNIIHFPSYLLSDYVQLDGKTFKNLIMEFAQVTPKTDAKGIVTVK